MAGRHRALTRRPWWQVVLAPRRRGRSLSAVARDDGPATPGTVLLAAAGLAGVLAGSTLDGGLGTAVMAVSALVPSVVLGGTLARTRTSLAHESWQRHRLAGEVAVSDEQVRRLADRVDRLADQGVDDAAELERTRRQLRRARVELAGATAVLSGVREEAARAAGAAAAREAVRAAAHEADAAREAERDRARRRVGHAVAQAAAAVGQAAWRPAPRTEGRRSFASVDLRVFDAFTEAGLAVEDAVLDAPVRRGRHVADLDVGPTTATVPTVTGPRAVPTLVPTPVPTELPTGPAAAAAVRREVA